MLTKKAFTSGSRYAGTGGHGETLVMSVKVVIKYVLWSTKLLEI